MVNVIASMQEKKLLLPYTFKTVRGLLALYFVMPLVVSGLFLLMLKDHLDEATTWLVSFFPCYLSWPLAVYGYFCRVILLDDKMCARTLFSKQEISYAQIKSVDVEHEVRSHSGAKADYFCLVLTLNNELSPTRINISYNEPEMPTLLNLIAEHAPQASLSDFANQIRAGNIP